MAFVTKRNAAREWTFYPFAHDASAHPFCAPIRGLPELRPVRPHVVPSTQLSHLTDGKVTRPCRAAGRGFWVQTPAPHHPHNPPPLRHNKGPSSARVGHRPSSRHFCFFLLSAFLSHRTCTPPGPTLALGSPDICGTGPCDARHLHGALRPAPLPRLPPWVSDRRGWQSGLRGTFSEGRFLLPQLGQVVYLSPG